MKSIWDYMVGFSLALIIGFYVKISTGFWIETIDFIFLLLLGTIITKLERSKKK